MKKEKDTRLRAVDFPDDASIDSAFSLLEKTNDIKFIRAFKRHVNKRVKRRIDHVIVMIYKKGLKPGVAVSFVYEPGRVTCMNFGGEAPPNKRGKPIIGRIEECPGVDGNRSNFKIRGLDNSTIYIVDPLLLRGTAEISDENITLEKVIT